MGAERGALLGAVAAVIGILAACDDTTFQSGTGGGTGGGEGWCGVTALFDSKCTSCHSPSGNVQGGLDLETDPYAAIVDAPSAYAGRTLVVAGDPAGSFLLVKLNGEQASSEGSTMPLSGVLPAATIDMVSAWIADGASDVCSGTPTDTGVGVCNTDNEDCALGTCGGEGPLMLPGSDCVACHTPVGVPEHVFTAGGTAFVDAEGSAPLTGGTITLTGDDGGVVTMPINGAGNFYTSAAIVTPFTAKITVDGVDREMVTPQTTGACDSCHRCGGAAGGKLFQP